MTIDPTARVRKENTTPSWVSAQPIEPETVAGSSMLLPESPLGRKVISH